MTDPTPIPAEPVKDPSVHTDPPRFEHLTEIVIHGVPEGYDWGWFSDAPPRMHIETIDRRRVRHRIWLESPTGKRIVEPDGDVAVALVEAVRPMVELARPKIEAAWTRFMLSRGWLCARLLAGGRVELSIYRDTSNERSEVFQVLWPGIIGQREPEPDDVTIVVDGEKPVLRLGTSGSTPEDVYLPALIW
jgi:hypothetical protein